MNAIAEELLRTVFAVKRRQLAEQGDVHDYAGHDLGNRRAARHVHDGLRAGIMADAAGTGRIRLRALDASRHRAGAVCDDCHRAFCDALERVDEGLAAGHAINAVVSRRDRALHREDVIAPIFLDCFLQMMLEGFAASRAQKVVVLQRDARQHKIGRQRRRRADKRFIAARTLMAVHPNHDRQRLLFRRFNHF